ncbi:hypothetical protein [Halalkalibacter oceani]|uniref:hypothetical protein n=1 Tax=Halalkalibacter oceani TaxID=1653776 RepID=UPI003392AA94
MLSMQMSHDAIIRGYKYKEELSVDCKDLTWWQLDCKPKIRTTIREYDTELIGEYTLDRPLLVEDEQLYISDLQKICTVKKVIRTTENKILYIVDGIYETEKPTDIEREKVEVELKKANDEYQKYLSSKSEEKSEQNHKWYQFWKQVIK